MSTDAVLVVAGVIPIHLLAGERRIYWAEGDKGRERQETLDKWQREYDNSENERWTGRLIKDVKKWSSTGYGVITYVLK